MPKDQARLPKANILVVDDTPDNLRLLIGILAEQGYDVHPAPNGTLALKFARITPPDLILSDIKMPEMDGYEVCERLKADVRTQDIPVIFLSVLSKISDKIKGFEVGGAGDCRTHAKKASVRFAQLVPDIQKIAELVQETSVASYEQSGGVGQISKFS